jgi:hypothetical protein
MDWTGTHLKSKALSKLLMWYQRNYRRLFEGSMSK